MPDGQSLVTHEHDGFVFTSANATEEELAKTVGAEAPPDEGSPEPTPEPQQEPVAASPESVEPPAPPTKKAEAKAGPEGRIAKLKTEIDQLTYSKHQTRAEAEAEQQQLAQLRAEREQIRREIEAAKQAKAPEPEPAKEAAPERAAEPALDDFDDVAQWVTAHSKWTREQAKLDVQETQQQRQTEHQQQYLAQQQAAQQQYMQQKWAEHEQRFTAYVQAHPEAVPIFQAAAQLPMSKQHDMLMTHVLHSEKGPEILRFLAEHPTECERLSTLPAGPTLIELGRIEERLAAVQVGAARQSRPVTRTNPPITPVGRSAEVSDAADPGDLLSLPLPEYVARMNQQDARRRG